MSGEDEAFLQEAKKQLAIAEKNLFDIQTNPYFLGLDAIDQLTMEIEELKVSTGFTTRSCLILGRRLIAVK